MTPHRLSLALAAGELSLPDDGPVALIGVSAAHSFDGIAPERLCAVQSFYPEHRALAQRGLAVTTEIGGPYAAALVQMPRSKDLARLWIDAAWRALPKGGLLLIDGAKTDGIDSVLKRLRGVVEVEGTFAKAHGKLFWIRRAATDALGAWPLPGPAAPDGFVSCPGVFSADRVDPGSALLTEVLPPLSGRVADLGAGWGYLSRHVLREPKLRELDLIEADLRALDCARRNIADPRARFHWADARDFRGDPYDAVVCNPPFHSGRAADPALGLAFIASARRLLRRSGALWLVANRHLPYERALEEGFAHVRVATVGGGYKVLAATHPRGTG